MTALVWGKQNSRKYEHGVDRGVIYPEASSGLSTEGQAWPGLRSVVKSYPTKRTSELVYDGRKYLDSVDYGDPEFRLRAFSAPSSAWYCLGEKPAYPGFYITGQYPSEFNLSYRTMMDDGAGYFIHLLTRITATIGTLSSETRSDTPSPSEFEWTFTTRPIEMKAGFLWASHFKLDSTKISPVMMSAIEEILYGSVNNPTPTFFTAAMLDDLVNDGIFEPISEPI